MKKKETTDVFKAPAKVQSFEEVQKALQGLTQQLNDLGIATNSKAEGEITDKDGKTGDIRITQNADKTYGLELKTDEGWKFPTVGESPVQLTSKKGEKARPDVVVDSFKDELGKPKNMPKPDYDSGWLYYLDDGSTTEEMTTRILEHNFGTIPSWIQIWFTPFTAYNDGDPLYAVETYSPGMVGSNNMGNWRGENVFLGKNKVFWHHYEGSNAFAFTMHDQYSMLPTLITDAGEGQSSSGNFRNWKKGYFKVLLWK